MNRREFIRGALACGAASRFQLPLAHGAGYHGKLFVFIQADGGWDPTSFCDPKTNVPGEAVINHWARGNEVRQAGNLRYAPFASNAAFFEKYHDRMLVINGVDAQTNSHAAGIVHNWSGQLAEGYPTTTAILAAHNGGGMSMPYLSFGGFSNPAGLAVYTRLDDATVVRSIAAPDLPAGPATAPFIKRRRLGIDPGGPVIVLRSHRIGAEPSSPVGPQSPPLRRGRHPRGDGRAEGIRVRHSRTRRVEGD